jgi:hypothetical protein
MGVIMSIVATQLNEMYLGAQQTFGDIAANTAIIASHSKLPGNELGDAAQASITAFAGLPMGGFEQCSTSSLVSTLLIMFALLSSIAAFILLFTKKYNVGEFGEAGHYQRSSMLAIAAVAITSGLISVIAWLVADDLSQPIVWINCNTQGLSVLAGATIAISIAGLFHAQTFGYCLDSAPADESAPRTAFTQRKNIIDIHIAGQNSSLDNNAS